MKIYTKQGDAGLTGLYLGPRIPKDHLRIQCYGTVDELNAALGLVLSDAHLASDLTSRLLRIQGELFQLGAELATPQGKQPGIAMISEAHVEAMEREIDEMETSLTPLKNFILPGGTVGSARLHFARTVSRRAEREVVSLNREEPLRPEVLKYLNRLSDYLFVCARTANLRAAGQGDIPWIAPRGSSA